MLVFVQLFSDLVLMFGTAVPVMCFSCFLQLFQRSALSPLTMCALVQLGSSHTAAIPCLMFIANPLQLRGRIHCS